jgi:hypothetical protein
VVRSPDKYVPSAQKDAVLSFAMIMAFWAVNIGIDIHRFGDPVGINLEGVQWALAWTATLIGGLLAGAIIGAAERFGRLVWSMFLTLTLLQAFAYGFALWRGVPLEGVTDERMYRFTLIGALMGGVVGEHWYGRAGILAYILAPLALLGAFLFARDGLVPTPMLDQQRRQEQMVVSDLTAEDYAAAQAPLLAAQTAALEDGRDGSPQLFALLVGGYADQSVFLNEVEGVREILDDQYGAGVRTVTLANSLVAPLRYPEVSWDNLVGATRLLSEAMGPEDVLFLFLTSHGREDGFGLTFHPAAGRERTGMRAEDLAELLDRFHDGPAIIVVSSCRSGSFVDDLARPDRLVITASAADRNSFGCRDGANWTRFGQYFFDVALRAEPDPRKAFAAAIPLVEAAERLRPWAQPSQPQISEGEAVGVILDRLLATEKTKGE